MLISVQNDAPRLFHIQHVLDWSCNHSCIVDLVFRLRARIHPSILTKRDQSMSSVTRAYGLNRKLPLNPLLKKNAERRIRTADLPHQRRTLQTARLSRCPIQKVFFNRLRMFNLSLWRFDKVKSRLKIYEWMNEWMNESFISLKQYSFYKWER